MACPEYLEQYISLALSAASVCGLVMRNAIMTDEQNKLQKMETISTFVGGIAHDFNNLLGIILGYIDMALDKNFSIRVSGEISRQGLSGLLQGEGSYHKNHHLDVHEHSARDYALS